MSGEKRWARILAPLSGTPEDEAVLGAARTLAEPFGAEVAGVFAPTDAAELMPWVGEGIMGGVYLTALDSLKEANREGEGRARSAYQAAGVQGGFTALSSPIWAAMGMEARLSDVVVFPEAAARGRGPLAQTFEQVLTEERRPVLVARPGLARGGTAVVAWDGGKEATRAARAAVPWLRQAGRTVIVSVRSSGVRPFEPARLAAYYAARGVPAEVTELQPSGDVAKQLLGATREAGANLLVAGAFGHPRLQEFIFGGSTRVFLHSDGPALFLSH